MNKGLKKYIPMAVLLCLIFSGEVLKAENTALSSVDTLAQPSGYAVYLDSAARYTEDGRFSEAAACYEAGLKAYKDHYRSQMENINRELAASYEMDKKEQEYEHLNQSLSLRKARSALFTVLIIVLIGAVALLFATQKYRLQAINQKRLEKERETAYLKLEKEKKELEAQLNTLQAGKYQKELLAGTMLVEYKNKVLEELRLFFETHPDLKKHRSNLEKIMTEEPSDEPEITTFETNLEHIHPVFYARLQKQANNKLTPLDLKYCRMIYLKMSSKEMADLLAVDPKTIRVTKYRLKQKLGLGKEDDLGGFIEGMG